MKVSTEIDNNFGNEKITQLVDNIPLMSNGYIYIYIYCYFLSETSTLRLLVFMKPLQIHQTSKPPLFQTVPIILVSKTSGYEFNLDHLITRTPTGLKQHIIKKGD
jgi:hypothetical protein